MKTLSIIILIVVIVFIIWWFVDTPKQSIAPTALPTTQIPSVTTSTNPVPQNPPPLTKAIEPVIVSISNYAFNPNVVTIKAGTTIVWTNQDSVAHTVTSDTGAFSSGPISPNGSYNFTFTMPGTYTYHCSIHPDMKGTIVVTS